MINRSGIGRNYGCLPSEFKDHHLKMDRVVPILRGAALPNSDGRLIPFSPPSCDQIAVGMCTGAGTSRALKTVMAFLKYKYPFMPSALWLYAKTRMKEGVPLNVDSGCSIMDIFDVISTQGICPEDSNHAWSWPFSASDNRWTLRPPAPCDEHAEMHKVEFMIVKPDPDDIKTALMNGFTVVIGMQVHESFEGKQVALDGIIPMPGIFDSVIGGHCMYINAFGNFKDDYFDGVNSWGPDWGAKVGGVGGRFHIPAKLLCDPEQVTDLVAIKVAA